MSERGAPWAGTTHAHGQIGHPIDPPTRAYIHILRACNLDYDAIAERVDLDRSTVGAVLRETRERVADGGDPVEVYGEVVAPVFTLEPVIEEAADPSYGDPGPAGHGMARALENTDPDEIGGGE